MRQTGKRAVRRGMRVATHHGHARQRRTVFRADDMHDALALILERKVGQRADFADIGVQRLDLLTGDRILDPLLPVVGRRIVVGRGHNRTHPPRLAPCQLEPLKGLRTGDFVHQMTIDIDQRRAVRVLANHMAEPQLFVKRLCLLHLVFQHTVNV